MSGHNAVEPPAAGTPAGVRAPDEIASVDRAIATLEGQRATLGDAVVDTALEPLRKRRAELATPRTEQRRLVTIVFADVVDFTVLSRQLDSEDVRELMGAYFARWRQEIEAQGGVVEKFIGDAVMAVFGLSRSFEDDAQRAVRAAIRMRDCLPELNAQLEKRYGVTLHMRVGIDTGEVVVSTLGEREQAFVAVGPTVNRAARLEAAAPVDQVLMSQDTQRLVRGNFSIDAKPGMQLKGIDQPVDAFVVLNERRLGFRLDRSAGIEGIETSTVGRDPQLRFLQDRMRDVVEERRWRVVTIMGDAGVGKSRLLFDFDAWLAELPESVWWFRGRASPATKSSPHALLRDLVSARLDLQIDDPAEKVRTRFLEAFSTALGPERGLRTAALIGSWLGYDIQVEGIEVPTDPQALRDQGTVALGEYFKQLSQDNPVVVLLEDLHWSDEGTLRWLDAVAEVLAEAQVLVVGTARPTLLDTHPRWGEGLSHHVRVPLPALSRRESRELVQQILRKVQDPPPALLELVIDSAEGNPFYIEELVTWLIDAGVIVRGETDWFVVDELVNTVAVPSSLKGVLQARLDALSPQERTLVQRASVIGRVFWDLAVARLAGDEEQGPAFEEQARESLQNLRRRELLLQREVSAFVSAREYVFKHALLRDVAYEGVLRSQRRRYHCRAARWLAETSAASGRTDEYAAVIADHFRRGADPSAAKWYLSAGIRAASVFALEEAEEMYVQALRVVAEDDPLLRFDILIAREALLDRIGQRDTQLQVLESMQELSSSLDKARQVQLQLALGRWHFVHSEYPRAGELAERAGALATEMGRPDLAAEAALWRGKALTWAEQTEPARAALSEAVTLSREADRPLLLGEALRYLSMAAGNVGDFEESLRLGTEARAVFARAGDHEMEGTALVQLGTTYFNMGRYAEAQAALEETLPIFRRSGHAYREAVNLGNLASIGLMLGQYATAQRFGRAALERLHELGENEAATTYEIVLAGVENDTNQLHQARERLARAVTGAREVAQPTLEADALSRLVFVDLALGDHPAALERAREAIQAGHGVASDLERAYTIQAFGYAALALEMWSEAGSAFDGAGQRFARLGRPSLVRECAVGRALVHAAQGSLATAVELVTPVLDHLTVEGLLGTAQPGRVLSGCLSVLAQAGDSRADSVRAQAATYLQARVAEIGDPALAEGFLAHPTIAPLTVDAAQMKTQNPSTRPR